MPICKKCRGCGLIANSEDQEPWSDWLALPLGSAAAVLTGIVKPMPCPECKGKGTMDVKPDDVDEARAHLGAALAQTLDDKDDPVIMGHVREAYRLLGGKR